MASPTSIRFPEPLREQIARRASVERRTFSNQVVVLLEAALEPSEVTPRQGAVVATLRDERGAHEVGAGG
jgi:hypothetical protein